jgi:hypothetical protein
MKQYRSILSATFALLVLFSGSSFVVGVHLCGGDIQNVALFTKAEGCVMEKKRTPPCHKPASKPCCEDETIIHEGDDFKASSADITISGAPSLDMELPPVIVSEIIPSSPVSRIRFYDYNPPSRSGDLTVSLQVFLI